MLSILLNVSEEGTVVHSSPIAIVVAFVVSAAVFAVILYYMEKFSTEKEVAKKGGIREYCPNLVDFIMKHYPLARIVSETPSEISIIAADVYQFIKMTFDLDLNTQNMDVEIKGKIIPDQEKWPDSPSKEFVWILTNNANRDSDELTIINAIKKDMVLKPESEK